MLRESHLLMRRASVLLAAVTLCVAAAAQTSPEKPKGSSPFLGKASAEDRAQAQATGEAIARQLLEAYDKGVTPELVQETSALKKKFDDIADASMAAERRKVLDFLGLDPDASTGLYVFVSWSMPLELLRSYAIEAMWSGGTLVFKGIPPGRDLAKFVTEDLRGLVYGKGAAANISIDPRLFDAFGVKAVPTLVFSKVKSEFQCQGVNPIPFKYGEKTLSYDSCPVLDANSFHKMLGSVSTNYFLQTVLEDGDKSVQPYLRALARGWANGNAPGKGQVGFQGKWEDVLSPEQRKAAIEGSGLVMPKDPSPEPAKK